MLSGSFIIIVIIIVLLINVLQNRCECFENKYFENEYSTFENQSEKNRPFIKIIDHSSDNKIPHITWPRNVCDPTKTNCKYYRFKTFAQGMTQDNNMGAWVNPSLLYNTFSDYKLFY